MLTISTLGKAAFRCAGVAIAIVAAAPTLGGPLNPPSGAVAPTGKTLTEVEPRIAINAANTPGDADSLFRIAQPGSYYLTGNINGVSGRSGIEIAADGVTVDLNGFTLQGVSGAFAGVRVDGTRSLITVKNGSIGGWTLGVSLTSGGLGEGMRVSDVIASGNLTNGIIVPALSVLTNCQVLNTLNLGSVGISTGSNCVLSNCAAHVNSGVGIAAGNSSTLTHCVASGNGNNGFSLGNTCVIANCVTQSNGGNGIVATESCTIRDCAARQNGNDGIQVSLSSSISGCTSTNNTGDGIQASSSCIVLNNVCNSNGQGAGSGAGIFALSLRNRIEGNQCTNNDRGIDVDGSGNFIIRNACGLNGADWDIVIGNYVGPILNPIPNTTPANSSTHPGSVGTQDPHANFTY